MMSLFFMIFVHFVSAADTTLFGKGEFTQEPVQLNTLMKDYEKYKGHDVVMTGSVKKVCQMSGCWFEMANGADSVRITMKDYGFTVPKEILNKNVKVVGVIEQKELPVKVVKHYLKDEGKPQSEIDKIKEPQKVFEFVASAVKIL